MIFELSGNGNPLWHATKPEAKNQHRWIAEGWSWVNASLHLTPNPNSALHLRLVRPNAVSNMLTWPSAD